IGHLVHRGPTEFGTTTQRQPYDNQVDPHVGMTKKQAAHWDLERPFFSRLSEDQMIELLHSDIQKYEHTVNGSVSVRLTQSQFDALVSFCFNIGRHAFS